MSAFRGVRVRTGPTAVTTGNRKDDWQSKFHNVPPIPKGTCASFPERNSTFTRRVNAMYTAKDHPKGGLSVEHSAAYRSEPIR
jgi:hypothetical protein